VSPIIGSTVAHVVEQWVGLVVILGAVVVGFHFVSGYLWYLLVRNFLGRRRARAHGYIVLGDTSSGALDLVEYKDDLWRRATFNEWRMGRWRAQKAAQALSPPYPWF
jgi:hypothetical protein